MHFNVSLLKSQTIEATTMKRSKDVPKTFFSVISQTSSFFPSSCKAFIPPFLPSSLPSFSSLTLHSEAEEKEIIAYSIFANER